MKVRAIRLGYYNHKRRREGEIFELLDDKSFSNKWMEKLEGATRKAKPKVVADEAPQSSSEEVI